MCTMHSYLFASPRVRVLKIFNQADEKLHLLLSRALFISLASNFYIFATMCLYFPSVVEAGGLG